MFLGRPPNLTDIAGTMVPLLRTMQGQHVEQVVFLSVKGVNPAMPHWRVERALRALGLPSTSLRAADFMQNLEGPYRDQVRDKSRLVLPAGGGRTSFVDTRDVAAVAVRRLLQPTPGFRTVTCTGPESLSWYAVAGILSDVLGRAVWYQPVGVRAVQRRLRESGAAPAMVNVQTAIHLTARFGLAAGVSDGIQQVLGRPATPFLAYATDARASWL